MWQAIYWLAILAIVAGLGVLAAVLARAYMSGTSPTEIFFKARPEPRIEVIEQASIDGKRRLLLIRRDDVEHLVMTGGPVDVVIETGIGDTPRRAADMAASSAAAPQAATVFTRPPRGFGSAPPLPDAPDTAVRS